jgi:hypothetical protein
VRVTYLAGLNTFNEWLAFEHSGYAAEGGAVVGLHGGSAAVPHPFPKTRRGGAGRADDGELVMPSTISVQARPGTKFTDIVGRSFPKRAEGMP